MTDVDPTTQSTDELASSSMEDTSLSADAASKSDRNMQRGNTDRPTDSVDYLTSRTVTIVREKLKPLILKLRNPQCSLLGLWSAIKPEKDVDRTVDELGEELIVCVTNAVNSIRDEVKQARPQPDEENYEVKMIIYQELLTYITEIMKKFTNALSQSLTEFRMLIDQLWEKIQGSRSDDEVQDCIDRFTNETEQVFKDAMSKDIEPLLEVIEVKMNIPK